MSVVAEAAATATTEVCCLAAGRRAGCADVGQALLRNHRDAPGFVDARRLGHVPGYAPFTTFASLLAGHAPAAPEKHLRGATAESR